MGFSGLWVGWGGTTTCLTSHTQNNLVSCASCILKCFVIFTFVQDASVKVLTQASTHVATMAITEYLAKACPSSWTGTFSGSQSSQHNHPYCTGLQMHNATQAGLQQTTAQNISSRATADSIYLCLTLQVLSCPKISPLTSSIPLTPLATTSPLRYGLGTHMRHISPCCMGYCDIINVTML